MRLDYLWSLQRRWGGRQKTQSFLAILLIRQKQQKEGIVIEMPETGSNEEKVWGSDNYNNTYYRISYYTV